MVGRLSRQVGRIIFFRRYPLFKQFVKFCLVGLSNFVIDFLIYLGLTRVFNLFYIVAAVFSFLVAVSWSFYFNRRWTFRHGGRDLRRQYIKFILANAVSMALNLFLFYVLVGRFGIYDLIAKLMVAIIVAFVNFALNRFWTFRV